MKICIVATTTHVGAERNEALGSSTHVYEIAYNFAVKGHKVYVVSEKVTIYDKKVEQVSRFTVIRFGRAIPHAVRKKKFFLIKLFKPLKIFSILKLAFQTASLIRKEKIQLIIERSQSLGVGAIASWLTNVPLFLEVIDDQYSYLSLKRAKYIFAYTKDIIPFQYHNKTEIVMAGVNTSIYKPIKTKKKYDLGFVGAFKPWEGLEYLVKAVNLLKNKGQNITAILIGSGVEFNNIKKLITDYSLEKNFKLTGKVNMEKVPVLLSKSKIGVAPYYNSNIDIGRFDKFGFYFSPLKVVEYISCGIPVLASNYPLINNIVRPPTFGITTSPGNIEELAQAIEYMLFNQDKWKQEDLLKQASKLTWESLVNKMLKVIQKY